MILFPEWDAGEVRARVAAAWQLEGPLPIPTDVIRCPCGAGPAELVGRRWRVFLRADDPAEPHRLAWRCDVALKCGRCSLVLEYGLAITAADAARYGAGRRNVVTYNAREARARLGAHRRDSLKYQAPPS